MIASIHKILQDSLGYRAFIISFFQVLVYEFGRYDVAAASVHGHSLSSHRSGDEPSSKHHSSYSLSVNIASTSFIVEVYIQKICAVRQLIPFPPSRDEHRAMFLLPPAAQKEKRERGSAGWRPDSPPGSPAIPIGGQPTNPSQPDPTNPSQPSRESEGDADELLVPLVGALQHRIQSVSNQVRVLLNEADHRGCS